MAYYGNAQEPRGLKGIRQTVVITSNPSTLDQNQQLSVRCPKLSDNDIIVPRSARLIFEIYINSTDANATIYKNIGGKTITMIQISGNEVMLIDDSDMYPYHDDPWKYPTERINIVYQGVGKPTC